MNDGILQMLGQLFRGVTSNDEFRNEAMAADSTAGRELLLNMGQWQPEALSEEELLKLFALEQEESDSRITGPKQHRPVHSKVLR